MPAGTDTVAIQEISTRENGEVVLAKATAKGKNVRVAGLDFKAGDTPLPRSRRLSARDLALAAALNHATVPVHRRPKLALFATGDELVPPGTTPGPGQITYSNGFALMALARAEGAEVVDLGIVREVAHDGTDGVGVQAEALGQLLGRCVIEKVGFTDLVMSLGTRVGVRNRSASAGERAMAVGW